MSDSVLGFSGKYRFMSNFSASTATLKKQILGAISSGVYVKVMARTI